MAPRLGPRCWWHFFFFFLFAINGTCESTPRFNEWVFSLFRVRSAARDLHSVAIPRKPSEMPFAYLGRTIEDDLLLDPSLCLTRRLHENLLKQTNTP
ncbi:hypothetical protein P170DRAFT_115659 [Aspergillus steynii IBT 23096]|uniref:Secreted protein n=1 Tax=Aspergillus steynii IBT 23096 TaxID=1392250 RepID=A0A2I2GJ26_9EURO|nr:uncharacterized protein P170DRAFT_115659 [Aspergillus steynii IBT 23096]PLB52882.1 hypothetical protein P170DRAFT_115659 [Aspergillus steynii IBT 23096]